MKKILALALSLGLVFSMPVALGATQTVTGANEASNKTVDLSPSDNPYDSGDNGGGSSTDEETTDEDDGNPYDGDDDSDGSSDDTQEEDGLPYDGDDENGGSDDSSQETDDSKLIVVVYGTFTYEDGSAASGLTVKLHSKTQTTTTDSKGYFKFADKVAVGKHTLTVMDKDKVLAVVKVNISEDGVDVLESTVAKDVFTFNSSNITKNNKLTRIEVEVDGVITADMEEKATDTTSSPKTGDGMATRAAGAIFVVAVGGVALFLSGRKYRKL